MNTKTKTGYGAYLVTSDLDASMDSLKKSIQVKRFEQTSSTKLELQTFLWALCEILSLNDEGDIFLNVYSDSQNIVELPGRRDRLEKNNYYSRKNKRLNNYKLYQKFYRLTDNINCKLYKVAGHSPSGKKNKIDSLFRLVDQASRNAARGDT